MGIAQTLTPCERAKLAVSDIVFKTPEKLRGTKLTDLKTMLDRQNITFGISS